MSNSNKLDPDVLNKYQELIQKGALAQGWGGPAPSHPGPGRPTGTVLKDKDTIVQETVERLSGLIAKLCNRYNLSDSVQMTTEVDLVETANYTTVTLTATIEWLPNPYVFVAQEKVKTSNKTAQNKASGVSISPGSAQSQSLTDQLEKQRQLEQARKQMEAIKRYLDKSESPK